ncbi:MAG: Ig-like domain-containing protein [Methanobacterium sp. ERen5]|nr:MAG: Ig-like domain-containing protein [Methanobacterium sp. ERen5]
MTIIVSGTVSAASTTVTPGPNAIKNAINNAHSGDTLNLNGTYYEHDLVVNKNLTIKGSNQIGVARSVIDAQKKGRIFLINSGVKLNLNYLQLVNGYTKSNKTNPNGGAIYNNKGTLSVNDTKINSNYANYGGGIYNYKGTVNLSNSPIFLNAAYYNGGGIYNTGTIVLNNATIFENVACYNYGGGLFNFGTTTINNSKFFENSAKYGGGGIYNNLYTAKITQTNIFLNNAPKGGGVYNNIGTLNMTFCRITNNHVNRGCDFFNVAGKVSIPYNWWGTNKKPATNIYGYTNINSWLVLSIKASPKLIPFGGQSNITADFLHDSNGFYHNPSYGYVPEGIPVYFNTDLGSINNSTRTVKGAATASLYSGDISGIANVTATDNQTTVSTLVNIDTIAPSVPDIDPKNNTVNVKPNKIITITFSEPIKLGNGQIYITNLQGQIIPTTTSINNNTLIITPNNLLNSGLYVVTLNSSSITDIAGNGVGTWSNVFGVGVPPQVVSVDPANNSYNIPANKAITITFNEPIKIGNGHIKLQDSNGKLIAITTSINNNILTITPVNNLNEDNYTIILNIGSITGLNNNPIDNWNSTFITGSSPTVSNIDPAKNAVNVVPSKEITIVFNEPIKIGNGHIKLQDSNGNFIAITASVNNNILTITPVNNLNEDKYYVTLFLGSVTDLAGNPVAYWNSTFSVGISPCVYSSDPENNSMNFATNKPITIVFDEPIRPGLMNITLTNSGTPILFTAVVSGKTLTITPNTALSPSTLYTVTLNPGSIVDLAGNPITFYTLNFRTGE